MIVSDLLTINGTSVAVLNKYIAALRRIDHEMRLYNETGPHKEVLHLIPQATTMAFVLNKCLGTEIILTIPICAIPKKEQPLVYVQGIFYDSLIQAQAALVILEMLID